MKITSAAFLLVAAMGWCASALPVSSGEHAPAGIDLTLRLGQPSSSQPGVASDGSVTGSSQIHVSSLLPDLHSSERVPETHYEGVVDEGSSRRTGWRRVDPADSVIESQARLRRTWIKYIREHLDQPETSARGAARSRVRLVCAYGRKPGTHVEASRFRLRPSLLACLILTKLRELELEVRFLLAGLRRRFAVPAPTGEHYKEHRPSMTRCHWDPLRSPMGVDLSLRLGPRPAAIRFPHGNVVSGPSGSSGQLTEASSSGLAQGGA
ncbi:hypothetical protein L1887_47636 [Cichorium endivia]|nr:hypothetical protein L1887_47636 [Cichorium endivia]